MTNAKPTYAARPSPKPRRPVRDEWGLFDPEQAGMPATIRALGERGSGSEAAAVLQCRFCAEALPPGVHQCPRCSNEIASSGQHAHELPRLDGRTPDMSQGGAVYALEHPTRCPHCARPMRTFRVLRLMRTQVPFTSTLPRKGYVIVCPECERVISAELSGLI